MNNCEELLNENILIKKENENLKLEINQLKEHLKKYTSPKKNKIYYEENKEEHKKNVKEYREKTNYVSTITAEKKKEYARQAYLNKKAKLQKIEKNEII
jgi:hypothetical protein